MDTTSMFIILNLMIGVMVILFGICVSAYYFVTGYKILGLISAGVTLTMVWVVVNILIVVYPYITWGD